MAKNKLTDLNNHLFAQLERLGDENLTPDELKEEIARAKSISGIAQNIITNAKVALEGVQFAYKYTYDDNKLPEQFKVKELASS